MEEKDYKDSVIYKIGQSIERERIRKEMHVPLICSIALDSLEAIEVYVERMLLTISKALSHLLR